MHKEFKRLLEKAIGVSEHVIAVNLDIRGFSSFCKERQDWEVANYIKIVYSKILEEYFDIASYYKPTGDGLIVIIPCDRENVKERVNYVVESCLKLVKNFSSMFNDEAILNFPKPSKIGIGITRGSLCCISNLEEDKILDYSGRILNLASRLMDMARPLGIVIDESLGQDLLKEEYKGLFTETKVCVRGISEKEPIVVYHTTKETVIPKEYKTPIVKHHWERQTITDDYKNIKTTKAVNIFIFLTSKPIDDNEVYLDIKFNEIDVEGSVIYQYSSNKKTIDIVHRGTKHIIRLNKKNLMEQVAQHKIADDCKIVFEFCYLAEDN